MGEIRGVREAVEDLGRRIKESGGSTEYAEKKTREAAQRLDQAIRAGKRQKSR